jgi:hypothetical protein
LSVGRQAFRCGPRSGGPKVAFGPRVPEQWICLFEGRAGARARAVFATEEQAKQFAERHAQLTATGMPLKWNDTNDPMELTTPVGEYRIVRTDED